MSRMRKHEISCPKCSQQQTVSVWDSINIGIDPSLRQLLFDRKINQFRCTSCNQEGFLNVPLLYHDPTRRYCIQYLPPKMLENMDSLEAYAADGKMRTVPFLERMETKYIGEPHIAFDMGEMIRYILFRELLYARDNPY